MRVACEAWLTSENDQEWVDAMLSCESAAADCGALGRCAFDGACFAFPGQFVFHAYEEAMSEALEAIVGVQGADLTGRLPGLAERLERARLAILRARKLAEKEAGP